MENDNLKGDGRAQWTPGKATSREKLCESWLCLTVFGLWCVVLEVGVFAQRARRGVSKSVVWEGAEFFSSCHNKGQ